MKTAYDTIQPIKTLHTQMERVIDLSNASSTPFTPSQNFSMAYNLVFNTGLYNDTCCKWRCCLPANRTWGIFQANYSTADQDLRESQLTAKSAGYHGANVASEETSVLKKFISTRDDHCSGQLSNCDICRSHRPG